ncbi:MAG: heavy-metal-associated domain-containing protein [Nocardiopsaceae bacterium]|nr:heavy-metal-associated domain-containing protein [Nocardiopsaceae bacterium]
MITANYTVVGMTCDHCVMSVTEEVGEVPGITDVDVDLATGRLVVTSDAPIDGSRIRSAVAEAGYAIADEA